MVTANLLLCVIATVYTTIKCTFAINNRARSTTPPLNMPLQDIPMFLTITIDDALHGDAHDKTGLAMNHVNRNNEPIPFIYFVSNEFTDYSYVQKRYLEGCEIAVHTVTHTTSVNTNITKWYNEIKTSRDFLSIHADIPLDEIVGFRAPFLEKSDFSFQVLAGLDPPLLYDSTIINKLEFNYPAEWDWPYTLDEYESGFVYTVGEGPKQSYPGLWEVPMYYLYSNISTQAFMDNMDYVGTYHELLNIFKANFLYRMNTNKVPMGIYLHPPWFNTQSNVDALNDFIEWVLNFADTWVVTNKDIIDWINNPITASQYQYTNNNQLMNGKTTFNECEYAVGHFWTVESTCPTEIPHDLRYNAGELVSSKITTSSHSSNTITISTDVCDPINDDYTLYSSGGVYCNSQTIQDTVRYNDVLYKCLWWTQGDNPATESVWKTYKNCIQNEITFIKGTIEPYGVTKTVFQDSVLNIDVTIHPGYDIPDASYISIVIDGTSSPQPLSYFEDYEFNRDAQANTINLIIRFIQIIDSEYEVIFSFKDVSLPPTQSPTSDTNNPSKAPTFVPTETPSKTPTKSPTNVPTQSPTTARPSKSPTMYPTQNPTRPTINPTMYPSNAPTYPSMSPTKYPSITPTKTPTVDDLCQLDTYTMYDVNVVYCEDGPDGTFVRYDNGLYQCKYRTESETPDSVIGKSVWVFRKPCSDLTTTELKDTMDAMGDDIDGIAMKMSYPIMVGSVIGFGGIIVAVFVICIMLCCIIRIQRRKLMVLKMEEGLKDRNSVTIGSTDMPSIPVQVNPMHQEMSPKSSAKTSAISF